MTSKKLPYMAWYTGDWLKDPALSLCAPASRGIWADLLCAMHEFDRVGKLSGTYDQLARLGRCSVAELKVALADLTKTKAADVTFRNGSVTVTNRRMLREHKDRESARLRKQKERKSQCMSQKSHNPQSESVSDSVSVSDSEPDLSDLKNSIKGQSESNGVVAPAEGQKPDPADQREITVGEAMEEAALVAKKLFRLLAFKGRDGKYLWQVAIAVAKGRLPESMAVSAANGVAEISKNSPVPRPIGYFRKTLERACVEKRIDLKRIIGLIKLPDGGNYGPPIEAENPMAVLLRESAAGST